MRRFENEEFFPAPPAQAGFASWRMRWFIPEDEFYGAARPEAEASWVARAASKPVRFGLILFAIGWTGILLQLGFVRQLVIGAPVFEEFAKFGPPLVFVALIGARTMWGRLPWAWLSGAAFGVFEHYSTYPDETLLMLGERIAFHAGATGLSMALYTVVEGLVDERARWMSTLPATVIHWGNNFGALVFAFVGLVLPYTEHVALGWTLAMTTLTFVITLLVVSDPEGWRERIAGLTGALMPHIAGPQSPAFTPGADAATALQAAPSAEAQAATTSSDVQEAEGGPAGPPPEAPR